jgi:dTDP-4-dehydrorhamnose 3,5-epimerase
MKIIDTSIPDIIHLQTEVHRDPRGQFMETYREEPYAVLGMREKFVQDNLVRSVKCVFRGLHFQLPPFEQAKLITMISGEILDVALDLRKDSETYLKTELINLSADDHDQLYIPAGFAHGYYVLSKEAIISYKVTKPYAPGHQGGIRWDSPEVGLREMIKDPLLSEQDKHLPFLNDLLSKILF